ncbi:single-stranded DNA-binding protein [Saimiriine betaherpesvirus 4]|uniref:Single-stranded DNA-binding protein n=1 Tax=Saimiriine betaherpesvirus 4 TaxID=1535247 RepID=G8XSX2_9BETA|nr:single-stranded DNA-binding protein [Saimiriine betaherpesvirus 4]AEV80918.1 single-stranded DNA-binding protein [Saimiriine betaherpesvirus 4]
MGDSELSAISPVGAAAYLYFMKIDERVNEILSVLSLCNKSSSVVIAPLLVDLTVDHDFSASVRTPVIRYDGGVLTKVTSFCPFAIYFHNTEGIRSFCEDHGNVEELCHETRQRYGVESFQSDAERTSTDINALCSLMGLDANEVTVHVVVGHGLKEFLYAGQLIPCPEECVTVRIGDCEGVRVPLYPSTLFTASETDKDVNDVSLISTNAFVLDRGLYVPSVSEVLFYYLYTSWGQALRFSETTILIESALKQFVHDSQQSVKLTPHKKYFGYMSQKLSNLEKDHLMLSDAVISELGFSFSSVFFDSAYSLSPSMIYSDWPLVMNAKNHQELMQSLIDLKLHFSTHVGALIFSGNSILYQNRLVFFAPSKGSVGGASGSSQDALLRAIQFSNGLVGLCEDSYNDSRRIVKCQGLISKEDRYTPKHLALVCGTCPQLFSAVVWYLNRMSMYNTGTNGADALYNHIVACSSKMCSACGGRCCHTCYGTAFIRVQSRLPTIPKQPKKEPYVVTMFSRFMNDVDILGTFGRRYPSDAKESAGEGKSDDAMTVSNRSTSVDRIYYLTKILEYCKKARLVDPVTGEDVFNIQTKSDFVSVVSALNTFIDDQAMSFVSEVRMKSSRDEVMGSTQAFNLDLNPYALSFNPIFVYEYYRAVLAIIQNVALITATSYIVDNPLTVSSVSRWVNQHFQSIYGAFSTASARKGFLFVRDIKSSKTVDHDRLMDFDSYRHGRYTVIPTEVKLCRLSVYALNMFRVKNRPICRASKGMPGHVFFRRDGTVKRNPAKGCLGFLLYKYHERLFPECPLSCLQFWQRVCANAVPKNISIGDMGEFNNFIKFLLGVTSDYSEHDLTDVQPDSFLSYVENRFHNKFLFYYGFKDYITTLHGLTTRLTCQNHAQFPYLLGATPDFESVVQYMARIKDLKCENGVPAPRAATVARESLMRTIFEQRSLVTVAFSIEKYTGSNSSKDIFQFGQIGYFVGSGVERSLNTSAMGSGDYKFMRQRCVLATKLVDVLIRKPRRDNVLFDADLIKNRVMTALDSDNLEHDPELVAMAEIMSSREDLPERDDVLFFVDGVEAVADSMMSKFTVVSDRGVVDFSLESLEKVFSTGVESVSEEGVHDLSSVFVNNVRDAARGSSSEQVAAGPLLDDGLVPAKRSRL